MKTSQNEEWKVIADFPLYEVSTKGRIRKSTTKRIKKPEISKTGYPTIRLSYGVAKKGKHFNIHTLVATAFLDNPNNYPCVNHIDGNKTNNDVTNLEWCSYSRNNKHAYDTGLKKPYQTIITPDQRVDVINMMKNGVKVKDIAKLFKVTESCIYMIRRRYFREVV